MTMYGPDLKIVEIVVNLPVGPDGTGVIDIVSQPLSLLLLHRDSIDFYNSQATNCKQEMDHA